MKRRPFNDQGRCAIRELPLKNNYGVNPDLRLSPSIDGVEVRRIMLVEIHPDHDAEETADTGTRISEVTGLMIKHVDLAKGTIQIAQRNWRGDIDDPKTEKGKRVLALGNLVDRYRAWIAKLKVNGPDAWVFPQEDDLKQPRWDSGVRQALKAAAALEGLDFPGFGPHSLRRANITWRQEVGGSAIEASKIAGHANTKTTEEYTIVQLRRQEELTRRVQHKRAKAAKRAKRAPERKEAAA